MIEGRVERRPVAKPRERGRPGRDFEIVKLPGGERGFRVHGTADPETCAKILTERRARRERAPEIEARKRRLKAKLIHRLRQRVDAAQKDLSRHGGRR